MNGKGAFVRLSLMLIAATLLLMSGLASADVGDAPVIGAGGDSMPEPERPGATAAMVASAVYPGLGQLFNGAETKSAVLGAVEALLVAGVLVEDRRTRNAFRHYQETGDSGYYDDYSKHYDRRQSLVWWAIGAALYGLTDAYVDAHLADFDRLPVFVPEGALEADGGDAVELRLGLTFRF